MDNIYKDNNYTLGRGEIHFARFKEGVKLPGKFIYIGNSPEFNLSIESEDLDHYSSDFGIREKDASVSLEVNRTGSMISDNISEDNLALFFFGSKEIVTTAASKGNSETITSALGDSIKLGVTEQDLTGAMGIDPTTFVVELAGGGTVFTVGVDYFLDAKSGLLTLWEKGGIDNDVEVDITYDILGSTRSRIISGSKAVEGAMMYKSRNPRGEAIDIYMPYIKVKPNGDFSLKGDEWQQIPFSLEILKLPNAEAIYLDGKPAYTELT